MASQTDPRVLSGTAQKPPLQNNPPFMKMFKHNLYHINEHFGMAQKPQNPPSWEIIPYYELYVLHYTFKLDIHVMSSKLKESTTDRQIKEIRKKKKHMKVSEGSPPLLQQLHCSSPPLP